MAPRHRKVRPQPWATRAGRGGYLRHLQHQQVASRNIAGVLRASARDAERAVASLLPPRGVGAEILRAQQQALSLELRRNQAKLWGHVTQATQAGMAGASTAAAESHATLARMLAMGGHNQLLVRQFELAARYSGEAVRAKYLNDVPLSSRVYKNEQLGIKRANAVVSRGLATNQSAKQIAAGVRDLIRPDTPGGVSYAANRLARTEINNSYHAVNSELYAESPWVTGVQWHLSGSHPRPDDCDDYADMDHDGIGEGIFLPRNTPEKPHPNCLCYTTAAVVEPDEFARKLQSGSYDNWLRNNGQSGFADVDVG